VSYAGPELLAGRHVTTSFDCGQLALKEWLVRRAGVNERTGTSRTWVITESGRAEVVGFYASATASVLRETAPKAFTRNQPEEMPAILLGRIGIDVRHQGSGLGGALLKHFMTKAIQVSESVGVRVVLVHAKEEVAKRFYGHYGFVESTVDPLTLMILISPP
jgi:GNAT superfamily N-acetyltransferase